MTGAVTFVALALVLAGTGDAGPGTHGLGTLRPPSRVPRPTLPVLDFPEAGLDDSAAYQGYRTRFYRDSKNNSVQLYVDERSGRFVQLWADAADESIGFTARDASGKPARLAWGGDTAWVSDSGADSGAAAGTGARTLAYRLTTDAARLELGWFALGTMRVERDIQYWKVHLRPYSAAPFRVAEESTLVAAVERLPAGERQRHLAELRASSVAALRARLEPAIDAPPTGTLANCARVRRPSLDGRNALTLELCVASGDAELRSTGRTVIVSARPGHRIVLAVRTTTDEAPLTPIAREEIFNRAFLDFLAGARAAAGRDSASGARARRLEREVRGVELLSSREKLMAGMPNYATYFGRDQMMTALMMQPVWTPVMSEAVIASVLRKLSPTGHVSHEEALAGQAIREHAGEYAALVDSALGDRGPARDSGLARARRLLGRLQETRENYNMLDGEFQLPVLVARYLDDPSVPAARKRAFLASPEPLQHGRSRLFLLVRELGRMTALTAPYARSARADSLVSFVKLDSAHWRSASWRDSRDGYANGRFAMDINAIWAPEALRATERIFSSLRTLGVDIRSAMVGNSELTYWALADYGLDSAKLHRAAETWSGAARHFTVTLAPGEIAARLNAKLAWMEPAERTYWTSTLGAAGPASQQPITFLALSLDSAARPIPVVNTDPATRLFLGDDGAAVVRGTLSADSAARLLDPFLRPYPVGLLIGNLGPVVANDAYASDTVWNAFKEDSYHGPRVVWGREVNLLLLGLAKQLATVESVNRTHTPAMDAYAGALRAAIDRVHGAVAASGFEHSELWSYRVSDSTLRPERYGISSDLQLWSSADLAVQFMLAQLQAAPR